MNLKKKNLLGQLIQVACVRRSPDARVNLRRTFHEDRLTRTAFPEWKCHTAVNTDVSPASELHQDYDWVQFSPWDAPRRTQTSGKNYLIELSHPMRESWLSDYQRHYSKGSGNWVKSDEVLVLPHVLGCKYTEGLSDGNIHLILIDYESCRSDASHAPVQNR